MIQCMENTFYLFLEFARSFLGGVMEHPPSGEPVQVDMFPLFGILCGALVGVALIRLFWYLVLE